MKNDSNKEVEYCKSLLYWVIVLITRGLMQIVCSVTGDSVKGSYPQNNFDKDDAELGVWLFDSLSHDPYILSRCSSNRVHESTFSSEITYYVYDCVIPLTYIVLLFPLQHFQNFPTMTESCLEDNDFPMCDEELQVLTTNGETVNMKHCKNFRMVCSKYLM